MFENYVINEFKGKYRWLSNMSSVQSFTIDGITYNSVENFYQAQKTLAVGTRLKISNMNPYEAKQWGKSIKIRDDWDSVKDDVMKQGLSIKFSQPNYYNLLANTGIYEIIEGNTWGDTYWGVSLKTNKGQNKLGKFITEIRTKIFEELDNTEMLIDSYENIRREFSFYDYLHMDKAVIRFVQNEFIKKYNTVVLDHYDSLLLEFSFENDTILNKCMDNSSDRTLPTKLSYELLTEFVKEFKAFAHQNISYTKIK